MTIKKSLHASIRRLPSFIDLDSQKKTEQNISKADLKFALPGVLNFGKLLLAQQRKTIPPYGLAIVAIVKNEAPYLREWVNYYLSLGASHFFIYDNGSTDNTQEELEHFSDKVTYIKFPGSRKQLDAYNDALTHYGPLCHYMAFLDADEFIYVQDQNQNLLDLLFNYFSRDHVGGLAINWQVFGSSHLEKKPQGLLTDNYVYRSETNFEKNHHIKSIVNPKYTAGFIDNPHSPYYLPNYYAIDANGDQLTAPITDEVNNDIIRINHYFTKSKEEFMQKKARGRATTTAQRTMQDFVDHDKNDIFDDSLRKYNRQHHLK